MTVSPLDPIWWAGCRAGPLLAPVAVAGAAAVTAGAREPDKQRPQEHKRIAHLCNLWFKTLVTLDNRTAAILLLLVLLLLRLLLEWAIRRGT